MAIFGARGRKAEDPGQSVVQPAAEPSEAEKLNGQISVLEKKLDELFLALGRTCFEQQRDDEASQNREAIRGIAGVYEEIQAAKERIRQIENAEKCPRCGAILASDALFCSNCGQKIERRPQAAPERQMFCMNCGAKLTEGAKFCIACGTPAGVVGTAGGGAERPQQPEAPAVGIKTV